MILDADRSQAATLIDEAVLSGAAKYKACTELGITIRTYQRWMAAGIIKSDVRPDSVRPIPKNNLTLAERKRLVDTMNSEAYKNCSGQVQPDTFLKEFSYSMGDRSPFDECNRSRL
jgi:putative transposase